MRNRRSSIGYKESDSNNKVCRRSGRNRPSDMRNRRSSIGYKESDSASWHTYSFLFLSAQFTSYIMRRIYVSKTLNKYIWKPKVFIRLGVLENGSSPSHTKVCRPGRGYHVFSFFVRVIYNVFYERVYRQIL